MRKYHRTIVIFQVKVWDTQMYYSFYERYIRDFSNSIPHWKNSFEITDFMMAVINLVLDSHFISDQEASERLEDFLDLYFVVNEEESRSGVEEAILTASGRHKLNLFIDEMAQVIGPDLLNVFHTRGLRYDEHFEIDDVMIRNGNISFVLIDLERPVW